jgi:metal-responsive CopG/Arc/MetJ family transcriptional regulator
MASVKTAISLEKSLFEQVEALAHEMNVSRSRLFVLAMEEFIQRQEGRKLFEQMNKAYEDPPDQEEQERLEHMLRLHRELIEQEEW